MSERHVDNRLRAAAHDRLKVVGRLRFGLVTALLVDPGRSLLPPADLDHDARSLEVDGFERRGPGDRAGERNLDVAGVTVSTTRRKNQASAKGAECSCPRPRSQSP